MSKSNLLGPNFVLIGAMKCGTSTLAAQLATHDGVFMTTPKEPNFFSDDAIYARGEQWYSNLFADALPGDIKGEASTHYTKLPTYPHTVARLQRYVADIKILYVIRNPVERAVSHYIHEWSEGRMSKHPDHAFAQHREIIDYGCYAMQLAPYVDTFGLENIRLTSLEQIKQDPDRAFKEIGAFLGLPDHASWNSDLEAQNISSERMRKIPLQGLLIDNPVARSLRRTLVPKSLRTWVRERRQLTRRPQIPSQLRQKMETRFLQDRSRLANLFPDHPALDLCYPFARP